MAKVFISFLGTGNPNTKADQPGYDVLDYRFENDDRIYTSMFAQRAIIEKHDPASFERICLMMTPESKAKHRDLLVEELLSIGCTEAQLIEDASITTNQNTEQQWEWFDSLQKLINDDDEVIFDFTHGFRSVPIIRTKLKRALRKYCAKLRVGKKWVSRATASLLLNYYPAIRKQLNPPIKS